MRMVSAEEVHRLLDYPGLVERLHEGFRAGCEVPLRHHHRIDTGDGEEGVLLLMPAWQAGQRIGLKSVSVFGGNPARGLPSVIGVYLLLDGTSGLPLALLDGTALTLRRTAAASVLAARFLARPDAGRLLMVGAGALAGHLARAYVAGLGIRQVRVWNRTPGRAASLAAGLAAEGIEAAVAGDLAAAVAEADVISCATMTRTPLVLGDWLRPGTHLDLVGGFTPEMREADDAALDRARIFVDTRDGACREAGDIADPLRRGVIGPQDIQGDLFDLCRGTAPGRRDEGEITLFKSVGTALEDLAAADLVYSRLD